MVLTKGLATRKVSCRGGQRSVPAAGKPSNCITLRLHHPRQTEGGLTRRTSARLLFDGDDAVLRNTFRRPSRRGHRSLPVAGTEGCPPRAHIAARRGHISLPAAGTYRCPPRAHIAARRGHRSLPAAGTDRCPPRQLPFCVARS